MNNPHTDHLHEAKGTVDPATAFGKLGDYVESLWENDSMNPEEKADAIREAALRLLRGEALAEDNVAHAGGHRVDTRQVESHSESDPLGLMGRAVPRKMSRKELQRAADKLTGGRGVEDDILEAIKRREGKRLMGHHGFHQ